MNGILFRGTLTLALLFIACDMLPTDEFEPTGTQFALNSNINVISITGDPDLSDVLPAGLLLVRRNSQTQHLLFLKDQAVTANVLTTKTLLGAFCCNKYRNIPDAGDTFDLGPITDNADLQQVISIVENKNISGYNDMWMVQRAVQMVTDSTGLTQAYIDSLNALPSATD
jgi:hypothetical protein